MKTRQTAEKPGREHGTQTLAAFGCTPPRGQNGQPAYNTAPTERQCTNAGHSQLEHELPEVALGCLLRHDVAHLLAHRSDLRGLRVAGLLDLVLLLLGEADARLTRWHTPGGQPQRQADRREGGGVDRHPGAGGGGSSMTGVLVFVRG